MPHSTLEQAYRASRGETPEDLSRPERLQRVLARLNRLHEPPASSNAAYSNRTPSPNRQSLYDWAPAYDESREQEQELDSILNELRRQQPETHPDLLRVLGQSQLDGSRQRESEQGTNDESVLREEQRTNVRLHSQNQTLMRERERRRRENEWMTLRSRAVLQRAARQEGAASPSSTERMLRYVMDRERSGLSEEEERARGSGWFRPTPRSGTEQHQSSASNRQSWQFPDPTAEARDRERQERVDAFRRGYLAENAPPRLPRVRTPPVPSQPRSTTRSAPTMLEHALVYLHVLRSCTGYEDALSAAMDHGLATKEFFADKHDDFIMDLDELPPMQYSSWLQPGTVLEGHQFAANFSASNIAHQGPTSNVSRVEQINPNFRPPNNSQISGYDHPPGSTRVVSFDNNRNTTSNLPMQMSPKGSDDYWPVRVILHTIDAEKMTLQGTMEAYDVPQHPSSLSNLNSNERPRAGKKHAPITTYLEGQIIDIRTHSFLTPGTEADQVASSNRPPTPPTRRSSISFPSTTTATDAQNWLKLSPFPALATSHGASSNKPHSALPEDTLARILLSKAALQQLQEEYIFMRWKEKCFVHGKNDTCSASAADRSGDQDRGHGLTISGFYYVSLRRADGEVEGLYFDPLSTPHQCLKLRGRSEGWASWGFR